MINVRSRFATVLATVVVVTLTATGLTACVVDTSAESSTTAAQPSPIPSGTDPVEVVFVDSAFRACVARALLQGENEAITVQQAASLTGWLLCEDLGITDITGAEALTNVSELYLGLLDDGGRPNQIVDLSPLAGLVNLRVLSLTANDITDLGPLAGLIGLDALYLAQNSIVDVGPLTGLINLTFLDLSANRIVDVSPLTKLANLGGLYLSHNLIMDVSALATLTTLQVLRIRENPITDFSPLDELGIEHS